MTDQKYALILHRDSQTARLARAVIGRYVFVTEDELDHTLPKGDFIGTLDAIYLEIDRRVPQHSRDGARLAIIKGLLPYARDNEELACLGSQAPSPNQLDLTPRMTRMGGDVYDAPSFTVKAKE